MPTPLGKALHSFAVGRYLVHAIILTFALTYAFAAGHVFSSSSRAPRGGPSGGGSYVNWYIHRLASVGPNDGQLYLKNPLLSERQYAAQVDDEAYVAAISSPPQRVQKTSQAATPVAPEPAQRVVAYKVAQGDTLSQIAGRFGLLEQTLAWSNNLSNADMLKVGQELKVPPVDGVLYEVRKGDTIASIADDYGVEPEAIVAFRPNDLINPNMLVIGKELVIPGGKIKPKPIPAPPAVVAAAAAASAPAPAAPKPAAPAPARAAARSDAGFSWPTTGPIFTYFGEGGHEGIDISPPWGTPVYASRDGVVTQTVKLGWSYGWYIMVDHGDGFSTMYAHLSRFDVTEGQAVARGQLIGAVGSTGRSTGPHLHFEIHRGGTPVNPLNYLP